MTGRAPPDELSLTKRERQIMDILYRHGSATVAGVLAEIPDPPSYSSIRALLRLLEEKGHIRHRSDGPRYVYQPRRRRDAEGRAAAKRLLETFFSGSVERAVSTLFDVSDEISEDEYARLEGLIDRAKKEGR